LDSGCLIAGHARILLKTEKDIVESWWSFNEGVENYMGSVTENGCQKVILQERDQKGNLNEAVLEL
jgi:hypothetical protein